MRLSLSAAKSIVIWFALLSTIAVAFWVAATSLYLAGRDVIYIASGFAAVLAVCILLVQPLLAAGILPGIRLWTSRRIHRWLGSVLAVAVLVHVVGLYITSPADAWDALTLNSPTPFSIYGVIGLWSVVLTVILVAAKSRLGLGERSWRVAHNGLAVVVVVSSVVHALMIDGTMGWYSKLFLCVCVLVVTGVVTLQLRIRKPTRRRRLRQS